MEQCFFHESYKGKVIICRNQDDSLKFLCSAEVVIFVVDKIILSITNNKLIVIPQEK